MGTADEESGRQSMSTIFRKVLKTTWVLINVLVGLGHCSPRQFAVKTPYTM
jgi:hypothetical protein